MVMTLVSLQIMIITYTVCGFILKKAGWFTKEGQSFLSALILAFLLPVSVFVSFYQNISFEILKDLAAVLNAAVFFEAVIYYLLRFDQTKDERIRSVAHYS